MKSKPAVAVVSGGISGEREVSLGSGQAVYSGLKDDFGAEMFELREASLPDGLDPKGHVVFSTLHGTFGEDGAFQQLLESAGVEFAGCESASSRLTFDKSETKKVLGEAGVPVLPEIVFDRNSPPDSEEAFEILEGPLVLKPLKEGSSLGLGFADSPAELERLLANLAFDFWMLEKRIIGREVSVGVIDGKPLGIVEIRPKSGQFDYESKYTKGKTEFLAPAPMSDSLSDRIRGIAQKSYEACDCRDYARVDVMIDLFDRPYVLELNTIPGMKETSLMPKSASCLGMNFKAMLKSIIEPAILRFRSKYSVC
ncbi:MAG: D-alanine--D-alanine ligase [Opitutaceae bacterium]|nr:D-alanine--D-alanine ligase [Opitutaceae bacterium]